MRKDVFRKGMVVGIIVLFIGASLPPSISGNNENDTTYGQILSLPDPYLEPPVWYDLEGPPGPVYGTYLDVYLTGVPGDDYDVWDGVWPAWCIDQYRTVGEGYLQLWDSYDSDMPYPDDDWDLVNYIINNYQVGDSTPYGTVTYWCIQKAIWEFINGGGYYGSDSVTDYIIDDAIANGEEFEPEEEQLCAVLLWPIYEDGTFRDDQITFIEVNVPGGGDQLPTCAIELQKDSVTIDTINVGEFFDIYVTEYSGNIQQIRFLSDEDQNGIIDPGFTWTDWYDWDTSTSDWTGTWNHENKIKTWAFATPGVKEVWAEVKDNIEQTGNGRANINALGNYKLEIISHMDINEDGQYQSNEGLEGWVFDIAKISNDPNFISDYFEVRITDENGRIFLEDIEPGQYLVSEWIKPEWNCPEKSGDEPYNQVISRTITINSEETNQIIFMNKLPDNPSLTTPDSSLPHTIRIYRDSLDHSKMEVIDFNHYVKGVLPPEWWINTNSEALRAGAIAIKMFAWSHVIIPKRSSNKAYLLDTPSDQVYDPDYSHGSETDNAVDNSWSTGLIDRSNSWCGYRYYTQYWNGYSTVDTNNNIYDITGPMLNIRKGPGDNYAIEGTISDGSNVIIVSNGRRISNGQYWFQIKATLNSNDYIVGWGNGDLLKRSLGGNSYTEINDMFGRLTQYGSQYWGNLGNRDYLWILYYFYPDAEIFDVSDPISNFKIGDTVQVTSENGLNVREQAWIGDNINWLATHNTLGTIIEMSKTEQNIIGKSGDPPNQPQSSHGPSDKKTSYNWWYVEWKDEDGNSHEGWSADINFNIIEPEVNIKSDCPVDICVIDPDNLIITKQINTIPDAIYVEMDLNGDGSPDDRVSILNKKIGDYIITVVPEPDASPTDTYSLFVFSDGITIVLAEDILISSIPNQPYIIRSTETGIFQIIPVTIDIDPNTLNLKSAGNWITCYIELPEEYNVEDIDISTILLNQVVPAENHPTNINDYDNDNIHDLMVKFDRQSVQDILTPGDNVEIKINCELTDGTKFEGTDYIRVI